MSNGFNYESPLNAFLSRGLPQMVSDIANREARKKALEKELEWKEDEAEKSRIFSAEQSRLSRESNEKWREESRQDQLRRDLDNTERQNRRERVNRTVRDEQNDKEMIISLSDSSLPTIQNWAKTNVMRTDIGEDRLSALLGRKERNAEYMTNVALNVPFSGAYKNSLAQAAKLGNIERFNTVLDRAVSSFASTGGMDKSQFEEWKGWLEARNSLMLQNILNTGTDKTSKKIRENFETQIVEIQTKMDTIRGVTTKQPDPNNKLETQRMAYNILSKKFDIPAEEFKIGGKGEVIIKAFNKIANDGLTRKEILKLANDFNFGEEEQTWKELLREMGFKIGEDKKGSKAETPRYIQEYKSLIKKSRTKDNIKKLDQLEKRYPDLIELNLR